MINKILLLVTVLLFPVSICYSQTEAPRFLIRGSVIDQQTNKAIGHFPIRVKEFDRTINANEKGEFLFNMTASKYTLIFDDYPFTNKEISIQLVSDTVLLILMQTPVGVHRLEEVQVVASKVFTDNLSSITKITSTDLKSLPAMIGERDILKVLSLTAGVTSSGEGAADIQVRGGLQGQNLFLLDKVPLYSTQHMFGMISAFNPIVIKSAELYKSGFPAEYGGRIASVLDVITKDPNLNTTDGEIELSILSSKAAVNVPIIKDKLGLNVAARISNYSLLNLISLANLIKDVKIGLHFADLNAGVLFKPTLKNALKLSVFYNSDGMSVTEKDGLGTSSGWLNNRQQNMTLNWQHQLSQKSTNTLLLFADGYRFECGSNYSSIHSVVNEYYKINSSINSSGIEEQINSKLTDQFSLNTGLSLKMYQFSPYNVSFTDSTYYIQNPSTNQYEGNLFIQTKYMIYPGHTFDTGLRFSSFGKTDKSYSSLEPRFSYFGALKNNFSISISASRMTQNIHRIANPGLGTSIELFQSSDGYLKPEKSWIYSVGVAKDFKIGKQQLSIKTDIWYKKMWNIVEFKDGYDAISILMSANYNTKHNSSYITQGVGEAYGIDVSGSYVLSKFKLTADYTLMEARNRFDELNNGQWFAAATDIRHSLSLISEIRLKKNWSFTATWQLRSGRPITLPTAVYPISDINFNTAAVIFQYGKRNVDGQAFQTIETERNNARIRPFHKLDFAFNRTYVIKKKYLSTLSFGIYNVYNRANPAYYFVDKKKIDGNYYPVLKSISMFPILPSFSWSVKF